MKNSNSVYTTWTEIILADKSVIYLIPLLLLATALLLRAVWVLFFWPGIANTDGSLWQLAEVMLELTVAGFIATFVAKD